MRTKTFVLAVAALAAGRLAGASVLYNVTDLGPGYALQADATVRGWFAPEFIATYVGMKRKEIAMVAGDDPAALCARYRAIY